MAKSAMDHSGRFSLRMAMRSPAWMPHSCKAWAVRATLRWKSDEEMGSHFPCWRCSMMRSRLRSAAEKKPSFSVARLMAACFGLQLNLLVSGPIRQCETLLGAREFERSEERRVGEEGRYWWAP